MVSDTDSEISRHWKREAPHGPQLFNDISPFHFDENADRRFTYHRESGSAMTVICLLREMNTSI